MIGRQCPVCESKWYSADTSEWTCEKCGRVLDDEHNIEEE